MNKNIYIRQKTPLFAITPLFKCKVKLRDIYLYEIYYGEIEGIPINLLNFHVIEIRPLNKNLIMIDLYIET